MLRQSFRKKIGGKSADMELRLWIEKSGAYGVKEIASIAKGC